MKQTWSFQRWRRRYFRLKGHKLYYAKDSKVSFNFLLFFVSLSDPDDKGLLGSDGPGVVLGKAWGGGGI